MNEGHNFIAVSFEEDSKAYEALAKLRQASRDGRVGVRSAAIVERDANGRVSVPDGADAVIGAGIAGGGLLGLMVGILGGPVGVVLGFGAGTLAGSIFDFRRAEHTDDVLGIVAAALPAGHTALVAEADEYAVEVVDGEMFSLGGSVIRIPAAEVLEALEAAERAADAAQQEARRIMHEQHKLERKARLAEIEASWNQRIDALKQRLNA